ncbi:hypothetical protein ACC691_41225, partial [Rhizobium johnstonii]|uniref:hypothetical protein n=1 Tax=Rhizobium johnstonii TaxID=3019933 RepID=UPI003F9E8754
LVVLLTAGAGTAWALDRFVIEHVQISDVSAYEASQSSSSARSTSPSAAATTDAAATVTDHSYSGNGSGIQISTVVTG